MLLILFVLLLALIYMPQLWVRHVMVKHGKTIEEIPGTGAELARHLLDRFDMVGYVVEETSDRQDHFSPSDKAVRLGPSNYSGKSLTAIAVAAHEVGHAIQHHRNEPIFTLRSRYLPMARFFEQMGLWILRLMPIIAIIVKAPPLVMAMVLISLLLQLVGALAHLIVLPEEWDASFNKALPLLNNGNYVPQAYSNSVRQVLKAAALTYFAGALANILNIARLFMIFRR